MLTPLMPPRHVIFGPPGSPVALANAAMVCHTLASHAGVAQWLERRPVTPEAAGSSPVIRAIFASVAQLVEHSTENARVAGSSPA